MRGDNERNETNFKRTIKAALLTHLPRPAGRPTLVLPHLLELERGEGVCATKLRTPLTLAGGLCEIRLEGHLGGAKRGEIGRFYGGGALEHPRRWRGAQWAGLFLGVPRCPEPPGAP